MTEVHDSRHIRVLWINGPFGAGKTTVARLLSESFDNAVIVDPESIGGLLRATLQAAAPVNDFQEWRSWRKLVAATINAVVAELNDAQCFVIVPQTITNRLYWSEIVASLEPSIEVAAVSLRVDRREHRRRVLLDTKESSAAKWRIDKFAAFESADWVRASFTPIDTTDLTPKEVTQYVKRIMQNADVGLR